MTVADPTEFETRLRQWVHNNLDPRWRERFKPDDRLGFLRQWDRRLHDGGWSPAIFWPPEFGGQGASASLRSLYERVMSELDAPHGLSHLAQVLIAPAIMQFGSTEHKEHLARIRSGEEAWCMGFSEPEAGSDLGSMSTSARRDDDGDWSITGSKIWTSFAHASDFCLLLARTGDTELREKALSVFLVDMRSPGIDIHPVRTARGDSQFNQVHFNEVRVPASALLGDVNAGWPLIRWMLARERGADFALPRYIELRRHFTRVLSAAGGEATDSVDAMRAGEHYAAVFVAGLGALHLLRCEQEGRSEPGLENSVKLLVTETWRTVADEQIRTWGDRVFATAGDEEMFDFLEARHFTIAAGTSQIQRNAVASRALLLPSTRERS